MRPLATNLLQQLVDCDYFRRHRMHCVVKKHQNYNWQMFVLCQYSKWHLNQFRRFCIGLTVVANRQTNKPLNNCRDVHPPTAMMQPFPSPFIGGPGYI